MGHSSIRLKVRRRKVAHLRAYSKQFTVRNNCIPKKVGEVKFSWDIPEEGYPQPKKLRHVQKGEKWINGALIKWHHKSELAGSASIKMNRVEYMEAYVQQKLDKWVRKNPAPIKDDAQPDIFEQEFMVPWKQAKDLAEERIRDFVVSVYDKLHLVGRYKANETGTTTFRNKKVADIKDKTGEGHNINELDPEKSPLLKKAQKLTNEEKVRDVKLVATTLKDHKQKKGRIILPKAA